MNQKLKKFITEALKHLAILAGFFLITLIYFSPSFEGKVLRQMDTEHAKALAQELKSIYEKTGHYGPWTNSLFGGMPAYTIYTPPHTKNNIFRPIKAIFRLFGILPYHDAAIFFLYLLGFYILLLSLKINKWLSGLLSLAFALSSYNIIIIAVGHLTKAYAIAFMPMVIAGFITIYEHRKYLLGGILLLIALGMQISTTHIQIVYYTALVAGIYLIYRLIIDYKEKQLKSWLKATILAAVISILAAIPNLVNLWESYELSKYSIRGGHSEVAETKQKGLAKEYALSWSYGIGETMTLLIPNFKGGASDYLGNNQKLMEKFSSPYKQYIAQQNSYFGPQPFTAGPVYFGAIIVFLFVLGLFIVKDKIKWWLLAISLISIVLAWGKHFPLITDLFFNYFPLYNKFRVVSMILVVASLAFPALAALTVKEIAENPQIIKQKFKYFIISFALTGGIALLVAIIPSIAGPFITPEENKQIQDLLAQNPANAAQLNAFVADLEQARSMLVQMDAFRSFLFIALAAIVILVYSYYAKKQKTLLYSALAILILADLWGVAWRYLNYDMYKPKRVAEAVFNPTLADKFILKTDLLEYRVLNLTRNPFNDALTSYFHKHIGGYSAVKLRRYQDIINYYLTDYVRTIYYALIDTATNVTDVIRPMQVLHMLNTLYIIYDPNQIPIINPYAFGNAWFVDAYKFVETPKQELEELSKNDLKRVAIINKKKYAHIQFPELSLMPDTTRKIELITYYPDSLVYKAKTNRTEFAVFSEIYYPVGWKAYIDGKEAEIINVDFILRGLIIPPGEHTIVMEFKPKSYYLARKIALAGSIIVAAILLFALGYGIYSLKNSKSTQNEKA